MKLQPLIILVIFVSGIFLLTLVASSCGDATTPTKQYTVSFSSNGGSTVASQTIKAGAMASKPADPTKATHNFAGWYKEAALTNLFDFNTAINADITLYAKWDLLLTITFNTNGANSNNIVSQIVNPGKKATAPTDPTKTDYIFAGWYRESTFVNKFDFNTPITTNTDLYALWTNKSLQGVLLVGTVPADLTGYDEVSRDVLQYHGANAKVVGHHVKVGGVGDGSSWSSASGSVKVVLDGITSSDTVHLVLVAAGVYTAGAAMTMKNNVAIIGGWPSVGGWTRSASDTTELNGGGTDMVFNNSYKYSVPLTTTAVLYAAKVANGNNSSKSGGGMNNYYGSPVLMNVTFSNNTASSGGGMNNFSSSPVLTNVTFSSNSATSTGGGMDNFNSSPVLTNVTFSGNTASNNGGGMNNYYGSPVLTNVTFSSNITNSGGGGMFNQNSSPVLTNVTFSSNTAKNLGGGMFNNLNSSPLLVNVTFSSNTASNNGGGMYNDNSSPLVINSIFWGNTATRGDAQYNQVESIYYSVVEGNMGTLAASDANGNVGINPTFTDLLAYDGQVKTVGFSGSSPFNRGLYVRRAGSMFYYSSDNSTWYTTPTLRATITLPGDAIDLTSTDATGYIRTGRPDAGAWEYRSP